MYCMVTGGAGSGKSEYAESLALSMADNSDRLFYIATMYPYDDDETRKRIERHRRLRAGKGFITIERPFEISEVLDEIKNHKEETDFSLVRVKKMRVEAQNECSDKIKQDYVQKPVSEHENNANYGYHDYNESEDSVVLIEDLTNLYANECFQSNGHQHEIVTPLRELAANVKALIVVSNELYCDGIRYPEETMGFMRELSLINRAIANDADQVFEVVAGIPVVLK